MEAWPLSFEQMEREHGRTVDVFFPHFCPHHGDLREPVEIVAVLYLVPHTFYREGT